MSLEALIQETAKKVIANMKDNPAVQVTQSGSTCGTTQMTKCSNLIVILDGYGEGLEQAIAQLNQLASSGVKGQVVLSRGVDTCKITCSDAIQPDTRVELAPGAIIYLPYLSVGLAGKIANLVEDEAAARIVTRGLLGQHQIFVGTSELDQVINGKQRLSFGLSQKLKEYQRLLKSYDLVVAKDLTQVAKACGTTLGTGLVNPVTPVVTAPATTAPVASVSKCTGATSGCEGCGKCVVLNTSGVSKVIESGADRVSATVGVEPVNSQLAAMIDHTVLKPNTTETDIRNLCEEAAKYKFASVCVNPGYVAMAAQMLRSSGVKVCTVIGFPLGATTPTVKAMETRDAIANGATEIDMVINVGALKSGNNALVKRDIEAVVEASRGQAIVKVILETSLLTDEEKVRACLLSKYAGADFVKTATGFGPGGATVEDIALMRKTVGAEMGVKASGGIRDLQTAQAMINAGATRVGASASVAIVKGAADSGKGY